MWRVKGRREMHATIWFGKPEENDRLRNMGIDGRILLKLIFKGIDRVA